MRFNDGMEFDTQGPLRMTYRKDGLYVVGKGLLIPVRDADEALGIIRDLTPYEKKVNG